jgi:thiol-disulfide isomerase/thioredoxin
MKNKIILIIIGVLFIAALLVSVKIYGKLSDKVDMPTTSTTDTLTETPTTDADTEEETADTAADFYAFDFDGNKVSLSEKIGKPVVVNFWATWCPPCKSELPHFEKLYKELGDKVEFMMVDMTDGRRETADIVKEFV